MIISPPRRAVVPTGVGPEVSPGRRPMMGIVMGRLMAPLHRRGMPLPGGGIARPPEAFGPIPGMDRRGQKQHGGEDAHYEPFFHASLLLVISLNGAFIG